MVTLLITSIFVLGFFGLIGIAIYFWQKPARNSETLELPPPHTMGLFTNAEPMQIATAVEDQLPAEKQEQSSDAELQARKTEAEQFIESWQESPDRNSTAKMLHLAALADDADFFCQAVETALSTWQRGSIPDLSAAELQTLFNSEFWVLSSRTRSSGAGFVLKRTLSRAKRELETS